jgi:WD40 repeat protein
MYVNRGKIMITTKSVVFSVKGFFAVVIFMFAMSLQAQERLLESTNSPEIVFQLELEPPQIVTAIEWNPESTLLATSNGDEVDIWEVATGEKVTEFQGDTFGVTSLSWNPDGDRLAALGNRVVVWDVDTGRNLNILEFPDNEANSGNVAWNNDGKKLAFSRWNYDPQTPFASIIQIWDEELEEVNNIGNRLTSSLHTAQWSPDGSKLAIADTNILSIWETATGDLLFETNDVIEVAALAWSPDSTRLAFGNVASLGLDRVGNIIFAPTIQVVDLSTEEIVTAIEGEIGVVKAMSWSPDGQLIATDSLDGIVILWDIESGTPITHIEGHNDEITSIKWSPDGRLLASASRDGTAKVWDVSHLSLAN